MNRARRPRAALAALAAVLALAGAARAQAPDALPEIDWEQRLGAELPLDARFTAEDGSSLALRELFGRRPVVLALVYYRCPMLCNLVLEGLVRGLRPLGLAAGTDFDVVALSIDPRETAELAAGKRAACVEAYGRGAAGWRFLVGDEPAIRAVADAVGFRYSFVELTGEYAHPAGVSVATRDGRLARVLFGVDFAPRDLEFALIEAGQGTIGSPVQKLLLRCFHYDPARGVYTLAVLRAIQLAGGATVLVLSFFVVRWLVRERRRAAGALS